MQLIKEVYYTLFLLFYRAFGSSWTDGINAWKGVGGLTVVEILIIITTSSCLELFIGAPLVVEVEKWILRTAILILFFANHFMLVRHGYGLRFEQEFVSFNRSKKIILYTISAFVLAGVIIAFVLSGHAHRGMIIELKGEN